MKFFDIVDSGCVVDPTLASRLGFSRTLAFGSDIALEQRPVQIAKKQVVLSKDIGTLMRAVKDPNVMAISLEGNEIIGKALAAAREAEKPVLIDISCIFSERQQERYHSIGRIRGLVRAATAARCNILIVSGAKDPDYMLSPSQLIEIAKFLGMTEEGARKAVSLLGECIDS